jgi:membrane protein YqaA with SNARE-associated domain
VLYLFRDQVEKLGQFGYLGAFLISLVSSLSIILPIPGIIILIAMGTIFNPILIAVAGAAGGSLGEISGYILGRSGRNMFEGSKTYLRAEAWMQRWGIWAIIVFSLVPILPADVAGIASGALRYPLWKFLLACMVGKTIKYIAVILAGLWGWQIILPRLPA